MMINQKRKRLKLYENVSIFKINQYEYYVHLNERGLYELRRTCYLGMDHPEDICLIGKSLEGLKEVATALQFTPAIWP